MCEVKGGCTCGNEYCETEDYIFPTKVAGQRTEITSLPSGQDLPETEVVERKQNNT